VNQKSFFLLATSLALSCLIACATGAPTATPDTQATVDVAIAATSTAQATLQANVDAAVEATAAVVVTPTLSPAIVEKSEEEMAASIDQAIADAADAADGCAGTAAEATADESLTPEEVEAVQMAVVEAEEAIAAAEALIDAYYGLYGELAVETITLLQAVEEDLALMAESVAALNDTLQDIDATLDQGLTLAQETIDQLEATAEAARARGDEARGAAQDWLQTVQMQREERVARALAIQPTEVAANRREALAGAFEYVDAVRAAATDNAVSRDELAHIAQLGANASAGLAAQGGPRLQDLAGSIDGITAQIARGEVSRARGSIGELEAALGDRPSLP